MSTVTIAPGAPGGTIRAISSKSDAHRNLICAALADKPTVFAPFTPSNDIDATKSCLAALGTSFLRTQDGGVTVTPGKTPDSPSLDCGESGSTLRFLLPVAAALGCGAVFTGHGRLPERRVSALLDAMRQNGCTPSAEHLPISLSGRLTPGEYAIIGNESSQYISGLLFALPLTGGDCHIRIIGPCSSRGYIEMTLRTVRRFGITVQEPETGFLVPGGQRYRSPGNAVLEGDWSNAAFFLAAGALGKTVTVTGLDAATAQRDCEIAPLLARFGAQITQQDGCVTVSPGHLAAQRIDVDQIPDLLPILAVTACAAEGETVLYNAARLRDKESDRLTTTAALLTALGGSVQEEPDALRIRGVGRLKGGTVDGAGDHRIVMAAAVAAAISEASVTIHGAEAVRKSYPGFFEDLKALGGNCDGVTVWN